MKNKEIIRLIIYLFLCLQPTAICAQGQMQPGWKIDALVEHSNSQDFDDDGGHMQENLKTEVKLTRSFKLNKSAMLGISAAHRFYDMDFAFDSGEPMFEKSASHAFRLSSNGMIHGRVCNKPFITMGHITLEASQWGIERLSGIGAAMLMLKSSRDEMLGVGLVALFNSTSSWPVFPMAFWRKVLSPEWTVNLNYPLYGMQYTISKQQTLSAGFTFDNDRLWLRPAVSGMPRVVMFNRSVVRTALRYDWRLPSQLSLTAIAGWEYTNKARLFHRCGHHERADFGSPSGLFGRVALSYKLK